MASWLIHLELGLIPVFYGGPLVILQPPLEFDVLFSGRFDFRVPDFDHSHYSDAFGGIFDGLDQSVDHLRQCDESEPLRAIRR